jgi:hypothetical protein
MTKLRHHLAPRKLFQGKYQTIKSIESILSSEYTPHKSRMDSLIYNDEPANKYRVVGGVDPIACRFCPTNPASLSLL